MGKEGLLMALEVCVAKDGSAPFATIREALDELARIDAASGVKPGGKDPEPAVIRLAPGTYRERVEVRRANTALVGSGAAVTRVELGLGARMGAGDGTLLGTFRTYTMLIDASDVCLRGLTVANDAGDGREVGQAIALYADGNRVSVEDCALLGRQDTLFLGPLPPREVQPGGFVGPKQFSPRAVGTSHFVRCLIEGDVDFVFGGGRALFEGCELRSVSRDTDPNGYVTAASTPEGEPYGLVFRDCRFTSEDCAEGTVYLGRPWRDWARTVLVGCELGAHIKPEGWHDWGKEAARVHAVYAGTELSGPGAAGAAWPEWTHELAAEELANYDACRVLGAWDGTWVGGLA